MSNVIAFPAALSGAADLTMSSLEIAELTGKEHRNVMRDGRNMLAELQGEGGLLRFEHSYKAGNGKMEPCLQLPSGSASSSCRATP